MDMGVEMQSIKVNAPAKVNLYLDIVGVRDDGYHLLQMINQSINLCDRLTITKSGGSGVTLSCNKSYIPLNNTNIAYKAAISYMETVKLQFGVDIEIFKNIPIEAGLAGGSADGAAVLLGLNRLCQNKLSKENLAQLGLELGADIPFCLTGGTSLVEGIGEKLTKVKHLPDCYIVIAKPEKGISTKYSFEKYDRLVNKPSPMISNILLGLEKSNLKFIGDSMFNSLESATDFPDMFKIKQKFFEMGAFGSCMTGSGSAVIGLFENKYRAKKCYRSLFSVSSQIFLSKPIQHGVFVDYL